MRHVLVSKILCEVTVDYRCTLRELVAAGRFDFIYSGIARNAFSLGWTAGTS